MPDKRELEFHYATFKTQPYKDESISSARALKNIIQKLSDSSIPSNKKILDRFKKRKGPEKRRLVHISSSFTDKGIRCYGRIALIKNKAPLFWGGKDVVEEIDNPKNREFIEVTNYLINFHSGGDATVMVEWNSSGARMSDILWYLRSIGKEYHIAKYMNYTQHFDVEFDDLEKSIKNIFDYLRISVVGHI